MNYPIAIMCRVLGVSTSGYYDWLKARISNHTLQDWILLGYIKEIYERSRGTYGAPRIHAELALKFNIHCSRKRVARLMREAGIKGVHRSKRRGCTRKDPKRPLYPDLVERNFKPEAPNKLWVGDITQHPTSEGWLYLAVVLDAFSRRVIGWSMGSRITSELAVNALNMAIKRRHPHRGVIHHSDHGSQYTSIVFTDRMKEAGILGSMGFVGDALDNAAAESFYATLQIELLDRNSWSTREELKNAIFEYIEVFYNRSRRHSTLEYLSPDEFEQRWFDEHEKPEAA